MIIGRGWAPGKAILFGEHAVVYGRPALAVPVTRVRAEAVVEESPSSGLTIYAQDLREDTVLSEAPAEHPLAAAVRLAFHQLGLRDPLPWRVRVSSSIPIASGLGSGAAVSAAIIRALADAAGQSLAPATVSDMVFEVDKLHHGTPSGVDNTVISYARPVYFMRGRAPEPITIGRPFHLAVADSGIASPTRITVGDVRRRHDKAPSRYEALFDRIAELVGAARTAIVEGEPAKLGRLMDRNHELLAEIGVSCPELDHLADAARRSGAAGAKLSGGGRGGNLIALVDERTGDAVAQALRLAGAINVILTVVGEDRPDNDTFGTYVRIN